MVTKLKNIEKIIAKSQNPAKKQKIGTIHEIAAKSASGKIKTW